MKKKCISIITPTFNEINNIDELIERLLKVTKRLDKYEFEIIIIDNASTDGTREKIAEYTKNNNIIKVINNIKNFGHIRSPYYGMLQTKGDATIYLASDLQDPPELIPDFIREWESGYYLVMAVKPISNMNSITHTVRKLYYKLIKIISQINIIENATGFGLYDRRVIADLVRINDPYPFLRGLICELGYEIKEVPFLQPRRLHGISKNNFYTLFDIALLGLISHSKLPIRLATFSGLFLGLVSIFIAFFFLIMKVLFWDLFPLGSAPLVIGLFFLLGVLLFFIGILGEYISSIHTYLQNRPIVIEKNRINF